MNLLQRIIYAIITICFIIFPFVISYNISLNISDAACPIILTILGLTACFLVVDLIIVIILYWLFIGIYWVLTGKKIELIKIHNKTIEIFSKITTKKDYIKDDKKGSLSIAEDKYDLL